MSEASTEHGKQKRGLGRGLGSLLSGVSENAEKEPIAPPPAKVAAPVAPSVAAAPPVVAIPPESRLWQIGIDKLKAGTYQPRKAFEKEALQELAQSIKENGILQPLIVRKVAGGQFEIVAGERRWRAAQLAGLHEVPVLIRAYENKQALELAIIENVQREDLNPVEEADAYARLSSEFHLSQQQIADRVGKDRTTVANAIRLLILPTEVKKMIADGSLSVGHAKVLLSLPDPRRQLELARRVVSEKLPVRKLEKLIADVAAGKSEADEGPVSTMNQLVSALGEELQKMYGTKVGIDYQRGRGKISISFYSDEELNKIVDQLKVGCQR